MAGGDGRDPDVPVCPVGRLVPGGVPRPELFHERHPRLQAQGGAQVEEIHPAKPRRGVLTEERHAGPHRVEERRRIVKEAVARSRVPRARGNAPRGHGFVDLPEPLQLQLLELGVFVERGHRPGEVHPVPPGEIGDQAGRLPVRDAHPPHPGVHADLHRDRCLPPGCQPVERVADLRVDHGRDVPHHCLFQVGVVERTHQENRFGDSGVPQRDRLAQLHDRHAGHALLGLENPGHVDEAHAVGVVLDDRQDGAAFHEAGDLPDVVADVIGSDLDPGIETGMTGASLGSGLGLGARVHRPPKRPGRERCLQHGTSGNSHGANSKDSPGRPPMPCTRIIQPTGSVTGEPDDE